MLMRCWSCSPQEKWDEGEGEEEEEGGRGWQDKEEKKRAKRKRRGRQKMLIQDREMFVSRKERKEEHQKRRYTVWIKSNKCY